MSGVLERRRAETKCRLEGLRDALASTARKHGDRACVYLTGSYARGEASAHSDLDLFIVGTQLPDGRRAFTRLDEICLKADLIATVRSFGIPDFSGDGEYLTHHTAGDLSNEIGSTEDDAKNTFTARLLLLLESQPLLGHVVYDTAIKEIVAAYWRDYEGHRDNFMPAYLSNDILRLWRTFCVNYEARTATESDEKKAKRRLKNFKLKHSRLLTCFSAIASLLAIHNRSKTVSPDDVREIVKQTPSQRLEMLESKFPKEVRAILDAYERFLGYTDAPESELLRRFSSPAEYRPKFEEAQAFGNAVFSLLTRLGQESEYFRHLVV